VRISDFCEFTQFTVLEIQKFRIKDIGAAGALLNRAVPIREAVRQALLRAASCAS